MANPGALPITALRQLLAPPAPTPSVERCGLCGTPVRGHHRHLVDIRTRRLLCACAVCIATDGTYRPVPTRYVDLPLMTIAPAQWEALAIPVDLVFFFFNSTLGRTVACYPGPAGAAESVLPLDAWPALAAANPWIRDAAPDVEAILVRRSADVYRCFLVPIDACYELVGRIRSGWTGLSGGATVRDDIDRFFAAIAERASSADAPAGPA